ncbi:MAG: Nucleoside-diphosphate-sugar epimerase [uncultured bacterium (gcode 4)]|uniref:Nucleoside-diphosphate-sugar epimerase n=1 Tax=uncultured bacterium (gcode 4) TaxID=1234023 RepID=K2G2V7_9BACT|nr:MAG: Nucleoside-diphosphate-sugar epimerase [uncultured bacterium (gcode 4)]
MKVAITWSTWFVWQHLVNLFSSRWDEVTAFWRRENFSFWSDKIKYIKWDITRRIDSNLRNQQFDVFISSASETNWKYPLWEMMKNNANSVQNVLELANNSEHCIVVSTSSVYQWLDWVLKESQAINEGSLKNSYALTKFLAEQEYLKKFEASKKLTILRPRAIYWKWDRILIPSILQASLFNRLCMFWHWENLTSITHINNLCSAILFLIENQRDNRQVYNISDPEAIKMGEIFEIIKTRFAKSGIIHMPESAISIWRLWSENIFSYYADLFTLNKVLDISKIASLWFEPKHYDLVDFLKQNY